MNNLWKNKKVYVSAGIVLLLAVAVTFLYKVYKPDQEVQAGITEGDSQGSASQSAAITPTEALAAIATQAPVVAVEEEETVYVATAEEVINSKPVTTGSDNPDTESKDVTPTPAAQKKADTQGSGNNKTGSSDQSKATSNSKKPTPKPSKKEVKIIDESPDTIKDETVKEYKGGEKTGSGNSLKDIPGWDEAVKNQKPDGKYEDSSSGTVGSDPVGTWN